MKKKMTAVQWLSNHFSKLQKDGEKMSWQQIIDITNLALEMEREQHGNTWDAAIEAHENRGHNTSRSICDFDEYYPSTYSEPLKDKI